MVDLLEHLQLLFHKSRIYFSLIDFGLFDYLDCTSLLSLQVNGLVNFAELTCTELFLKSVQVTDISLNFVKASEVLEFDETLLFNGLCLYFALF